MIWHIRLGPMVKMQNGFCWDPCFVLPGNIVGAFMSPMCFLEIPNAAGIRICVSLLGHSAQQMLRLVANVLHDVT